MRNVLRFIVRGLIGIAGLVAVLGALFAYFAYSTAPEVPRLSGTLTRGTITVGGLQRTYRIYVPRGLAKGAPLLASASADGTYVRSERSWLSSTTLAASRSSRFFDPRPGSVSRVGLPFGVALELSGVEVKFTSEANRDGRSPLFQDWRHSESAARDVHCAKLCTSSRQSMPNLPIPRENSSMGPEPYCRWEGLLSPTIVQAFAADNFRTARKQLGTAIHGSATTCPTESPNLPEADLSKDLLLTIGTSAVGLKA